MEREARAATGAARGERPAHRAARRTGCRERAWETRAGRLDPAIPKLRRGFCFPSFPGPRRRAEKALVAVTRGRPPCTACPPAPWTTGVARPGRGGRLEEPEPAPDPIRGEPAARRDRRAGGGLPDAPDRGPLAPPVARRDRPEGPRGRGSGPPPGLASDRWRASPHRQPRRHRGRRGERGRPAALGRALPPSGRFAPRRAAPGPLAKGAGHRDRPLGGQGPSRTGFLPRPRPDAASARRGPARRGAGGGRRPRGAAGRRRAGRRPRRLGEAACAGPRGASAPVGAQHRGAVSATPGAILARGDPRPSRSSPEAAARQRGEPRGPGLSGILCGGRFRSADPEPFAEGDGELRPGFDPVPRRPFPVRGRAVQHEVQQLRRGLVGGGGPPRPHRPPKLRVQGLCGLRRADDPAHRLGEGEERDDAIPVSPPGRRDGGVLLAPGAGPEGVERREPGLGVRGAADGTQLRDDSLAVLPRDEVQGVADEMDDAEPAPGPDWGSGRRCRGRRPRWPRGGLQPTGRRRSRCRRRRGP